MYIDNEDGRIHMTPDEKMEMARKVVDFIKAEMIKEFPAGNPCNECVTSVLAVSVGPIMSDVMKTDHTGEMLGMAKLLVKADPLWRDAAAKLTIAALLTPAPRA